MACRHCGSNPEKIKAERARAAGMPIHALGPFLNHAPVQAADTLVDETPEE